MDTFYFFPSQRRAVHTCPNFLIFAFNGEPFFGQDRFDQFKWRLTQQGLKKRGA